MDTENNVSSENTSQNPSVQNDENKNCCGICLTAYKSPRILPCQHIFCRGCLTGLVEQTQTEKDADGQLIPLTCPLCREEIDLSNSEVNKLPMYFEDDDDDDEDSCENTGDEDVGEKEANDEDVGEKEANEDAGDKDDHISSYDDDYPNPSVDYDNNASDADYDRKELCTLCDQNVPAEYECFKCTSVFCGSCKEIHDILKKKHDVQDLELDLSQDKCLKHPQVKAGYFCLDCGRILCKECVKSEHSLHQTQTMKSYLMEIDGELEDYSSNIEFMMENAETTKERFYSNTESKVQYYIEKVKSLGEDFKTELEKACQMENKKQHKDKTLLYRINCMGRKIKKSKRQRKFNQNLISEIQDLQAKITTHKTFYHNNIDDIIDDEIGMMDVQMGRMFSIEEMKEKKTSKFFFFANINWKLSVKGERVTDDRQVDLCILLKPFIESEDTMLIEYVTTTVTFSVEGGKEDSTTSRQFTETFQSAKDQLKWEFKYYGKIASCVKVLFQDTNIKHRAQVD